MELDKPTTAAVSSAIPRSKWRVPSEIDLAVASRSDTRIICMIPSQRLLPAFQESSRLPGLGRWYSGLVTPGGATHRTAAHLQQTGATAAVAILVDRQL